MNSLKQITMFVFNRLATDARVQRSVHALSKQNRIRIFSYGRKTADLILENYNE